MAVMSSTRQLEWGWCGWCSLFSSVGPASFGMLFSVVWWFCVWVWRGWCLMSSWLSSGASTLAFLVVCM